MKKNLIRGGAIRRGFARVLGMALLVPVLASSLWAAGIYREQFQPLNCFMKEFVTIAPEDLKLVDEASPLLDSWPVSEKDASLVADHGKKLYEKYGSWCGGNFIHRAPRELRKSEKWRVEI